MSGAVGSKPVLTRSGLPVDAERFSFSRNSLRSMTSTHPFVRKESDESMSLWSVIVIRAVDSTEVRGQKAEGRKQKAESRRQKAERKIGEAISWMKFSSSVGTEGHRVCQSNLEPFRV